MKRQELFQWLFFRAFLACLFSPCLPPAFSAVVLICVLLDTAKVWSREMRRDK